MIEEKLRSVVGRPFYGKHGGGGSKRARPKPVGLSLPTARIPKVSGSGTSRCNRPGLAPHLTIRLGPSDASHVPGKPVFLPRSHRQPPLPSVGKRWALRALFCDQRLPGSGLGNLANTSSLAA